MYLRQILLITSLIILEGCSKISTFKDYAYIDVKQKYSWGSFTGRLLGIEKRIENNLSIRGGEYTLVTIFSSEQIQNNIVIDKLELHDSNTNIVKFQIKNKLFTFINHSEGDMHDAINLFKPIKLDYNKITLLIEWHFENDIDKTIYAIEKDFFTDYKEEEITFWDVLMGV